MKFQIALVVLASACAVNALSQTLVDNEFHMYRLKHAKSYASNAEHNLRKNIFESNLLAIKMHNAEAALGLHTYTLAVNKYADMTQDEFLAQYTSKNAKQFNGLKSTREANTASLPDEVDWRTEGYVTPIKDQAQCGSCWTFSATGSLEGAHFKSSGKLVSLSEQNLLDCVHPYTDGCNGGQMTDAFGYVKKHGINSESAYPYTAVDGKCVFDENAVVATITSFTEVDHTETALQEAVATVGPVSIGIDASHFSFQFYSEGVYHEAACSSYRLDHGVLAVGYGEYEGTAYWMVKNSWGTGWGMDGYIMMSRNRDNECGVATDASYPVA